MFPTVLTEKVIKYGKSNLGIQRYKCLKTNKVYQTEMTRFKTEDKLNVVFLYFKGLSFRKLGEIYSISHQTVKNWVDQFSIIISDNFKLSENQELKDIKSLEIDELYIYLV
jgi:transposase-like protein